MANAVKLAESHLWWSSPRFQRPFGEAPAVLCPFIPAPGHLPDRAYFPSPSPASFPAHPPPPPEHLLEFAELSRPACLNPSLHSSRGATDSSAPDSRQDQCSTEELAESHLWWSSAQLALDFRGRLQKLLRCFAPPPLPPATYPIAPISPPPPPPLSPLIPPSPSRASARFC